MKKTENVFIDYESLNSMILVYTHCIMCILQYLYLFSVFSKARFGRDGDSEGEDMSVLRVEGVGEWT